MLLSNGSDFSYLWIIYSKLNRIFAIHFPIEDRDRGETLRSKCQTRQNDSRFVRTAIINDRGVFAWVDDRWVWESLVHGAFEIDKAVKRVARKYEINQETKYAEQINTNLRSLSTTVDLACRSSRIFVRSWNNRNRFAEPAHIASRSKSECSISPTISHLEKRDHILQPLHPAARWHSEPPAEEEFSRKRVCDLKSNCRSAMGQFLGNYRLLVSTTKDAEKQVGVDRSKSR